MPFKRTLLIILELVIVFFVGWFLRHSVSVVAGTALVIIGTLCVMCLWYLYPRVTGKTKPKWQKLVMVIADVSLVAINGLLLK